MDVKIASAMCNVQVLHVLRLMLLMYNAYMYLCR